MNVPLIALQAEYQAEAVKLAASYGLPASLDEEDFYLALNTDGLALVWRSRTDLQPLQVSFTRGVQAWRQQQGGGRQEAVVRALGVAKGFRPRVLDATAGLGRDGLILAHAGCKVFLLERHPAIHALLDQAVLQAQQDVRIGTWVQERVQVLARGSLLAENQVESLAFVQPQAIYLDPMFPERDKAAAVKKEMQMLQALVGADEDADELFVVALAFASHRVVVKRPISAPFLGQQKPTSQVISKKHRFDMYIKQPYSV